MIAKTKEWYPVQTHRQTIDLVWNIKRSRSKSVCRVHTIIENELERYYELSTDNATVDVGELWHIASVFGNTNIENIRKSIRRHLDGKRGVHTKMLVNCLTKVTFYV